MRRLFAKQKVLKLEDHYPITNEAGDVVYLIDQDWKFLGYEVQASDPEGNPLFVVRQEIMNFMPTYTVTFTGGSVMEVKSRLSIFKKKIDISYNNRMLHLNGKFWSWEFSIVDEQEREVASIEQKLLTWGDTFVIEVLDEAYCDVAVAMMIIVDHLIDQEESSH